MLLVAFSSLALRALMSLSPIDCDPCLLVNSNSDDGVYSVTMPGPGHRTTPEIRAEMLDAAMFDIDGDGIEERVIIDDRESAFGSVTAVFYDVSTSQPYIAFQCQAGSIDTVEADCRAWYDGIQASTVAEGLDRIQSATRSDETLDWETQHLLIPNVTTQASMLLAIHSVDLARAQLALASGSEDAQTALETALLFREQRALRFTFAD
ncbi:hypothetical protein [Maricaulis maris]|uniref:hypothetical protein n=1 Tax=Maricaulis maris TaxID=74318 RepID=UPI003B8E387B